MPSIYPLRLKRRKKRYKKLNNKVFLFVFLLIFLFFTLIINISDIISSLITNSGSVFSSQKIEVSSYSVYAVSVCDFDNEFQANAYAKKVAQEGGAGYVYHNGEYFVIASCYPLLTYAQEVEDNLQSLGYNARIVNIKVDEVSRVYKGKNLEVFKSALNVFRSCYNELYDKLIAFDKGEAGKNQINSVLAKNLAKLSDIKKSMQELKKEEDVVLKNVIIEPLVSLETKLNNLMYSSKNSLAFSSEIKVALLDIVLLNQSLCKNFT